MRGKRILPVALSLALAVSTFGSVPAYAEDTDDETVYTIGDFIEWMLERTDLTDDMESELENALEMYEGYVESGEIVEGDEDDAAAIDNVAHSVWILGQIEECRDGDEYYAQVYDDIGVLYTNFSMMVGSAYTANVSIYEVAHVSSYSTFASNENLAWGYTDPTSGWYTKEKAYVTQAMEDLGYSVSDLTSSTWSEVLTLAATYGTIGHYTNLFYGASSGSIIMGVGYTTESYLYGTTSSSNAAKPSRYDAAYTIDEFSDYLYEYMLSIYASDADCGASSSDSVSWSYDLSSRTITISGSGAMADYSKGEAPWYFLSGAAEKIVLEEGVTSAGTYAFYGFDCVTDLELADSVTSIGNYAFYDCGSLTDIEMSAGLSEIGTYSFAYCDSLASVELPDGLSSIEKYGFGYCKALESITVPASVDTTGNYVFSGCTALKEAVIEGDIESMGGYMFISCTSLSSVSLPDDLTSIAKGTFYSCTSLEEIQIPASVETIGASAFANCTALTDVYYAGTRSGFSSITISSGNDALTDATLHIVLDLSNAVITLDAAEYAYTGSAVTPSVTVTYDGDTLTEGTDYELSYSNNKAVGTATVTAAGIGDVTGSVSASFTIKCTHSYVSSATAASCTASGLITYTCSICGDTYTETIAATGHTAAAAVKENVTAATCIAAGSYESVVYCSVCGEELSRETVTVSKTAHSYSGKVTKAATCTASGTMTYTCSVCGDTYTETIAATGHSYDGNVCTACGALKSSDISTASVTLSKTSYTYSGSACKPSVTVVVNGTTLTKGTDYTVSYSSNKNIGTGTVTVAGTGSYSGTASAEFTIVPGKVSISSASSSAAKKLTVKWGKLSGSVKYQVAYKKSGASSYTTVTTSSLSKTLSGLSAGSKYSVKVRAYKKVGSDTYYGSWSSVKTVTVKKAQTLTIKKSTKTVSYSKVKKAKQTVKAITKVSGAKGKVTYSKSSGKSYFTVNSSTGKITVKKGTPKGTYTVKVKVTSAAKGSYAKTSKTVSVKIKVK